MKVSRGANFRAAVEKPSIKHLPLTLGGGGGVNSKD